MADFTRHRPVRPISPARGNSVHQDAPIISCRATNPLSIEDDIAPVFLDATQAGATTATRLFRNTELFQALEQTVLPWFAESSPAGPFTAWSTGCSSGEETYCLAMVVLDRLTEGERKPWASLFGTDINHDRITEAREGRYTRPLPQAFPVRWWNVLKRYAAIDQHNVCMGRAVRAICRFLIHDLRRRPKKHTFHFIVCNHVLQYYDHSGQRRIIANLSSVLKPGGFLYLEGLTEMGLETTGLVRQTAPNLYRLP